MRPVVSSVIISNSCYADAPSAVEENYVKGGRIQPTKGVVHVATRCLER